MKEVLVTMNGKRVKFLIVVLLVGIMALVSACSGGKKEKESATQEAAVQTSEKQTEDGQTSGKQDADKQPAGKPAAEEQTNSTQVSAEQSEAAKPQDDQAAGGETAEGQEKAGSEAAGTAGEPPRVTENPTDETLTEGYDCMYIAAADNADKMEWRIVSPDGKTDIPVSEMSTYFPYMEYVEDHGAISLYNVSIEFDGWGSYCRFTNSAGSSDSNPAVTHVTPIEEEESEQKEQQPVQAEEVE